MDRQEWSVVNPVADVDIEKHGGATRLDDFSGKRIGLWWNGKPNGDIFLDELAHQLASRHPEMIPVRMWEIDAATTTAYGVPSDKLERMAQSADLLIGALAD
ncbi:MAG: hypothetical protein A3H35_14595 [Betaproteobacteria bacterium RIFCSPLOWO2_02_FULL_62_17]|nr:MAG: hypothetical protein A3H35_14595 [Betaproteobacteria bacterium RIFCSPLOWO2_02_FULL_62_17]